MSLINKTIPLNIGYSIIDEYKKVHPSRYTKYERDPWNPRILVKVKDNYNRITTLDKDNAYWVVDINADTKKIAVKTIDRWSGKRWYNEKAFDIVSKTTGRNTLSNFNSNCIPIKEVNEHKNIQ